MGFGCCTARQRKGRWPTEAGVTPRLGRWGDGKGVTPRVALETYLETTRDTRPHARVRDMAARRDRERHKDQDRKHTPLPGSILATWEPRATSSGPLVLKVPVLQRPFALKQNPDTLLPHKHSLLILPRGTTGPGGV